MTLRLRCAGSCQWKLNVAVIVVDPISKKLSIHERKKLRGNSRKSECVSKALRAARPKQNSGVPVHASPAVRDRVVDVSFDVGDAREMAAVERAVGEVIVEPLGGCAMEAAGI